MLYCHRVDISEGIDIKKSSTSKGCDIFHYLCFLNKCFKFQPHFYNRCHDLLMMSTNLSNSYILNNKNGYYRCIINGISKSEALKLL